MAYDDGVDLDEIDRRIIGELVADGRASMRSVAQNVHISRAHAYVRLERLQAAGVVDGFTARIAHERAGLKASAYVALSVRQASWQRLAAQLRQLAYIDHFALMGGDFDVLVLVRAPDNAALRRVILEELQSLDDVLSTRTWLIFDEANGPGAQWE